MELNHGVISVVIPLKTHHIFPRFDVFRETATSILSSSTTLLDASTLDSVHRQTILERASSMILTQWPAQRISSTNKTLHTRLANGWHTVSIRLAPRIWSESRRHPRATFNTQSPTKISHFTLSVQNHTSFYLSLPKYLPLNSSPPLPYTLGILVFTRCQQAAGACCFTRPK